MVEQFDELRREIEELERQLLDKKKEYRELKTAGLRSALEAKAEAERLVREEMKSLGVPYVNGWTGRFTF